MWRSGNRNGGGQYDNGDRDNFQDDRDDDDEDEEDYNSKSIAEIIEKDLTQSLVNVLESEREKNEDFEEEFGDLEAHRLIKELKYFVGEGTIEFSNNNLSILSSTIIELSALSSEKISKMTEECKTQLDKADLDDKLRYIFFTDQILKSYPKH